MNRKNKKFYDLPTTCSSKLFLKTITDNIKWQEESVRQHRTVLKIILKCVKNLHIYGLCNVGMHFSFAIFIKRGNSKFEQTSLLVFF